MTFKRGSGILLHITSLPSPFGIGDFGPGAFEFIDQLANAQQSYWQILPLNPTDDIFKNSPYSSPSAFAINPLLISPEILLANGWITPEEAPDISNNSQDAIDFQSVREQKEKMLRAAFERWQKTAGPEYDTFLNEQNYWLDDYSLYMALKKSQNDVSWIEWPIELRDHKADELQQKRKEFANEIQFICFEQYIAQTQWMTLKTACNKKGIQIIGDLPIYIEHGSVDVWRQPNSFKLDENKRPTVVAGVPPDYFSETGQRWGNPIYNWEEIKRNNFDWWTDRLSRNLKLFDIVRIDHFRGLVAFWQVPAEEKTAIIGDWIKAPTDALFNRLKQACPKFNVIAEDLGLINDDVVKALERYDLPRMKVLQFAFNADLGKNPFLPHNYPENCVVYSGTHDNNTSVGWHRCDATDHEKWQIGAYIKYNVTEENVHTALIELALTSRANVAIIPVQDILGLDERARLNTPGTTINNWNWRLLPGQLAQEIIDQLSSLTRSCNRA
jgi:4-alpha-glucanotransferase